MTLAWKEADELKGGTLDPVCTGLQPPLAKDSSYLLVDFDRLHLVAEKFVDLVRPEESQELEDFSQNLETLFSAISSSVDLGQLEGDFVTFKRELFGEDASPLVGPPIADRTIDRGDRFDIALSGFLRDKAQSLFNPVISTTFDGCKSVGVVDFSIAFLNRRFRREGGTKTRFEMIWIQDRNITPTAGDPPPYAKLFGLGTLLLREDIDKLIARHLHDGWLDEEAAYAEFSRPPRGYRDAWAQRVDHGTAILDHMAGAEPGEVDDTRPIYAVELPTTVLADTSGQRLVAPLLLGLTAIGAMSYIIPITREEDPNVPLVMNASFAFTGGPEDGENVYAKGLAQLMNAFEAHGGRDIKLTVPMGNHLQDRIYAQANAMGEIVLEWLIPEGDRTPSTVEVYSKLGFDEAYLSIAPPSSRFIDVGALPRRGEYRDLVKDGETLCRLARPNTPWPDHLLIKVRATEDLSEGSVVAPSGPWRIKFRTEGKPWQFWIRRDETLSNFRPAGRQSRFRDFGYQRYGDSGDLSIEDKVGPVRPHFVSRDGTGSVLAAASASSAVIHAVAGTENRTALKPASKRETPYRFGGRRKDVSATEEAKAEESRALGGPSAAGRFGRSKVRLAGTSIASAIFAKEILNGP